MTVEQLIEHYVTTTGSPDLAVIAMRDAVILLERCGPALKGLAENTAQAADVLEETT